MDLVICHLFQKMESVLARRTNWTQEGFTLYRKLDGDHDQNPKQVLPVHKRTLESFADYGLYRSLIDSDNFRVDGLMKKSIRVRLHDWYWRLVSYHRAEHDMSDCLACML